MPSIDDTLDFIKAAHAGQTDKAGAPYWRHPVAVMERLAAPSDDERHAALLHDVVEDTAVTLDDLRRLGYGEGVVAIVALLTRDKSDGLTYLDWIRSIAASGNAAAIRIKIADNEHNSDPARLAQLPREARDLENRYQRSLKILRAALDDPAGIL
jgi:(p)ppGpp synthase/HD superfamily hydrolase